MQRSFASPLVHQFKDLPLDLKPPGLVDRACLRDLIESSLQFFNGQWSSLPFSYVAAVMYAVLTKTFVLLMEDDELPFMMLPSLSI